MPSRHVSAIPIVIATVFGAWSPLAAQAVVAGDVVHATTGAPIAGATVVLVPRGPGLLAPDGAGAAGTTAFIAGTRAAVTSDASPTCR